MCDVSSGSFTDARRRRRPSLGHSLNLAITFGAFDPKMAVCVPVVIDPLADFGPTEPADMGLTDSTPAWTEQLITSAMSVPAIASPW